MKDHFKTGKPLKVQTIGSCDPHIAIAFSDEHHVVSIIDDCVVSLSKQASGITSNGRRVPAMYFAGVDDMYKVN